MPICALGQAYLILAAIAPDLTSISFALLVLSVVLTPVSIGLHHLVLALILTVIVTEESTNGILAIEHAIIFVNTIMLFDMAYQLISISSTCLLCTLCLSFGVIRCPVREVPFTHLVLCLPWIGCCGRCYICAISYVILGYALLKR